MHDLVDPPPDLVAQPWRYDFFAALRLLERTYPDVPRWGTAQRLGDDPLRLAQHVSLAFEPAMIAQLRLREGRAALLAVNFFGLTGANGPMPLHFSEDVLSRQINHGDSTLANFLDVFHHRLLSLLYRSWARVRPVVWADRPADDRFADYVSAFSPGESRALPSATRFYAPQLIDQRRSAAGLLALVRDLLRLPVALSTLGRHRTVLAFDERLQLGRRRESARLGGAALLGRRLWNIQHGFCLHLGPLSWADYQHLLPGGRYFEALCQLVECYVGPALQWDLDLRLESGQRPGLRLGAPQGLGRGCWLGHRCAATPGWRFEPARFQRATPTSAG
ncbi:type VI secretion system baseplate subunit TssG [Pseudomonas gingeri]|uniref:type VI secretion system baseplate subunit TssG n=1 Tax=Pseudomonas gingeri TaxID=117681 RepID=UPI0015A22911|nr:type VI secretion system baseplate subunit TssG [Pseudomonas gingeri]NWA25921.1 type VI secretion system baseplate subunit TssG [Pseudomonas gingeri]